jgi:predicted component of type VI protein secretion system
MRSQRSSAKRCAIRPVIKDDVLDTIEEMIARIDRKLTAQMNEVLHAPEFQQIESALARTALPRVQFRDRCESQDSRHERHQETNCTAT